MQQNKNLESTSGKSSGKSSESTSHSLQVENESIRKEGSPLCLLCLHFTGIFVNIGKYSKDMIVKMCHNVSGTYNRWQEDQN